MRIVSSSDEVLLIQCSNSVVNDILDNRAELLFNLEQPQSQSSTVLSIQFTTQPCERPPTLILKDSVFTLHKRTVEAPHHLIHMSPAILLPIESKHVIEDVYENESDEGTLSCSAAEVTEFRFAEVEQADLGSLFDWLWLETQARAAAGFENFQAVTVAELLAAPTACPSRAALTVLFETFPILVTAPIAAQGTTIPWEKFQLFPLDEARDLAILGAEFFQKLRTHLREFGESEETFQEVSLFTSSHLLKLTCEDINFCLSVLSSKQSRLKWEQMTCELLSGSLCTYQIMRYYMSAVKTGFEHIVPPVTEGGDDLHYLDSIAALDTVTRGIRTTHKVAVRAMLSPAKLGLLAFRAHDHEHGWPLTSEALMAYNYQNPHAALSLADLLTFESPQLSLTISSNLDILKKHDDSGTVYGLVHFWSRSLNLGDAIHAEKEWFSIGGEVSRRWAPWNWNVSLYNEVARCMIGGKFTGKKMINQISSAYDLSSKSESWQALLSSGQSFLIRLPVNFLECLTPDGNLRTDCTFAEDTALFRIGCDSRKLSWKWGARLRDLFRLNPLWSRDVLFEYMKPVLDFAGAPHFDEIVTTMLKPVDEDGYVLSNNGLCLERGE